MPRRKQLAETIFTVSEFLTAAECDGYIAMTESKGYAEAAVSTPMGEQIVVRGIRDNDRVIVDDEPLAQRLWERVRPYCPPFVKGYEAIGMNERFRFYRYDPGQVFRWHVDGAYRRPNGEMSRLTFMIYLNDDFEGGETHFEAQSVKPEKGMALLFAHGYLHEGGEVFAGRKYVLRSDIMFAAEPYKLADGE